MSPDPGTTRLLDDGDLPRMLRRKLRLEVLSGPDKGLCRTLEGEEISVGSLPQSDVCLHDSSVSRYHLRIAAGRRGFVLTDLDSTNGTYVGGLRLGEATVSGPLELRIGDSVLRLEPCTEEAEVPLHPDPSLGRMQGRSPQMRALFAQVKQVARSEATVLIEGETGVGKELLAEELHRGSPRRDGPFVVVDCGALPDTLLESELFGHRRGAFTGAHSDRRGALELAHGGTLFLDEVGELSPMAQPRLLRALEQRQVKPLGADRPLSLDVRIVAATHRDLRLGVNEGTFRADLYFRLQVVRLLVPPLRERPEDIELLARQFLEEHWRRLAPERPVPALGPDTMQRLVAHRWPGNVRELRNFMERVAVLARGGSPAPEGPDLPITGSPRSGLEVDAREPYREAKARWIDGFEVAYVEQLLSLHDGNVAAAARGAGMDRTHLFRLIRKYGLRRGPTAEP